jgi:hypothetical protein
MSESRKIIFVLTLGVVLISIPPLLFTGNLFVCSGIDYSETGEIGDTIGGLTAPFVGIFGALLVYISFLKQVEANKILKTEIDRANFFNTYNEITQLLELSISQYDKINYNGEIGDKAFDSWINSYTKKNIIDLPNKFFIKECVYLLELIDKTSKSIESFYDENDIEPKEINRENTKSNNNFNYKNLLRIKFRHYYQLKYNPTLIRFKNFNESKEIEDIYEDGARFIEFINKRSQEEKQIYYLFQRILKSIKNIEITLNRNNQNYWGFKQHKNDRIKK